MYNCRKCNSSEMIMTTNKNNTGLYCQSCGAWQKWLSKEEIRTAKFNKISVFIEEPPKRDIKNNKNVEELFSQPSEVSPFDTPLKNEKESIIKTTNETVTIEVPLETAKVLLSFMKDLETQVNNLPL